MHIAGRGAFGAAAAYSEAGKEGTERWHQVSPSLQDHWDTAASCFHKQAQGDDSSAAPQTRTTPKALGMSDAMRPPLASWKGSTGGASSMSGREEHVAGGCHTARFFPISSILLISATS